ncbi:unnamed protein product, partial [Ectocarpus fasciculatus]
RGRRAPRGGKLGGGGEREPGPLLSPGPPVAAAAAGVVLPSFCWAGWVSHPCVRLVYGHLLFYPAGSAASFCCGGGPNRRTDGAGAVRVFRNGAVRSGAVPPPLWQQQRLRRGGEMIGRSVGREKAVKSHEDKTACPVAKCPRDVEYGDGRCAVTAGRLCLLVSVL